MRNIISFVFTVVIAVFAFVGSIAFAEDSKAKHSVGWEQTEIVWQRTSAGFVKEVTVTCTQVSAKWSKCRTFDLNGWVETKICNNKGCEIVGKR